jgi:A nuclease of the HNH/ENDO VII superfamily with conserved WHH
MTRPGDTVEGIAVPRGDPEALYAATGQLSGIAAQLEGSSVRLAGMPSLMSGWAGPGSSAFAGLTGSESVSVRSAAGSLFGASLSVRIAAQGIEDAQRRARRAIERATDARERIDRARDAIWEAESAQSDARGRMEAAAAARAAAEQRMLAAVVDAFAGDGSAALAAAVADAAYREAERDLLEAQRRERHARHRLEQAIEDLRTAREHGREAAGDARATGAGLELALGQLPAGALATTGAPARSHITAAAGIPRPEAPDLPISEREPPDDWPGPLKSWFELGRGAATAIDGVVGMGKDAVANPEQVPGAVGDLASRTWHDPLGTGKALIGYDELASGRYEDWLGQLGIGLVGGAAGTVPSRASRLNRVAGSPRIQQLGRAAPMNAAAFAGRRFDFAQPDLGARPGARVPKLAEVKRLKLAEEFPNGVRFTRAGYPVFTPYARRRVVVEDQIGDRPVDFKAANDVAGFHVTPEDFTWHHVEDGRTMELVPEELHRNVRHTGGVAAAPSQIGDVAPGGVFTPLERATALAGGGTGALAFGPHAAQEGGP